MPYTTKKEGNKWCVYKKDTGEKVGCTTSKEKLKKYLEALYVNEPKNSADKFKYLKNFSEDKSEATILMYDKIGNFIEDDGSLVEGICGADFASTLQYLEDGGCETVHLRINSPGGSVMEGWSIISAIKNSKMEIHTYNDGLCASISALIFATGDYRHAMDYSITMIHNPSGVEENDIIDKIKESLVTILKNNSIYSVEELNKLMDSETYFNADEALNAGICDFVINSGEKVEVESLDENEMVDVFNQIINKLDMKKNTVKNKLGVESPTTLTNEKEGKESEKEMEATVPTKVKDEDEVMDKLDTEDQPEYEGGDEEQDGDEKENDNDADDAMDYESMYKDLMESHNKAKEDFEKMKTEKDELSQKLDSMKDEVRKEHKKKIDLMVNDLFVAGKIGKTDIDSVTKLAENDFETVKNLFNKVGMVKNVTFKNVVNTDSASYNGIETGWTIRDYEKKNPAKLSEIKNSLPGVYSQLFRDFYGEEPK